MVSDAEDVHQSIQILLATSRGERPMQESFGASLDAVVFEEMDHALVNRVTNLIYDAILTHEPRVDLRAVAAKMTSVYAEPAVSPSLAATQAAWRFFANDDTTLPVLDPGRGRTKTGRLWCYAVDDRPWKGSGHPMAAYVYSDDRKSERRARQDEGDAVSLTDRPKSRRQER